MANKFASPKVSVGMPVYNGESFIRETLDSLLVQTYKDFELIISDNASTDLTEAICQEYAAKDSRIRYVRQAKNHGGSNNFQFVLDEAKGKYFMWSACDDIRSPDFLEENIRFLETHPEYVASTCPNCMEGEDPNSTALVTFSLEGSVEQRFQTFFDNCWKSHGIFYSVTRTHVLRECSHLLHQRVLGADWMIDLHLASQGLINRTEKGLMISGMEGLSNSVNRWRAFRSHPIHWIFPFYSVSLYAIRLSSGWFLQDRLTLLIKLVILNSNSAIQQFRSEFNL